MTWRLIHLDEGARTRTWPVVGEWSDKYVENVMQQVTRKKSNIRIHKDYPEFTELMKEFLPDPIREAL